MLQNEKSLFLLPKSRGKGKGRLLEAVTGSSPLLLCPLLFHVQWTHAAEPTSKGSRSPQQLYNLGSQRSRPASGMGAMPWGHGRTARHVPEAENSRLLPVPESFFFLRIRESFFLQAVTTTSPVTRMQCPADKSDRARSCLGLVQFAKTGEKRHCSSFVFI